MSSQTIDKQTKRLEVLYNLKSLHIIILTSKIALHKWNEREQKN